MKLAYADPPYLGKAWRYPEHPDALLGYIPGDTVTDLFPGSGVMDRITAQGALL